MSKHEFHDCREVKHFVTLCKRELVLYPRSPIAERVPHPIVMDESTPSLLRKQAA